MPRQPHTPISALMPLIIVLLVTAIWSFTTRAGARPQGEEPTTEPSAGECRAELEPATVAPGEDVRLEVALSEDPAAVTAVRSEERSGIVVQDFTVDEAAGNLVASLDIPLDAAGAWWLEFDAAGATCKALLTVTESALDR